MTTTITYRRHAKHLNLDRYNLTGCTMDGDSPSFEEFGDYPSAFEARAEAERLTANGVGFISEDGPPVEAWTIRLGFWTEVDLEDDVVHATWEQSDSSWSQCGGVIDGSVSWQDPEEY